MNRDSVRSPGPQLPRSRPSGPRSRRPINQTASPSVKLVSSTELTDESAPAYSGRNSPAISSHGGSTSSPVVPSFEQLAEVMHAQTAPANLRTCREQATQTDLLTPVPTRASTPAVRLIAKQPTLTPPSPLNFEPVSVAWKGLTLESAQWTLTSQELQAIVSRAIRKTAQESFIRLLPVKTADEELTAELERLEMLKATTQSQYRFNMHRRTMLLQSLLALGTTTGDFDSNALYTLTTQLADITSACDRLMTDLLRIVDQKAQILRLLDIHDTSALAMALRKLNASYAKRTTELREAREIAEQFKLELSEAWAVAHEMAEEMDALDEFHSGFSSDEDSADVDEERRLDDSVRLAEVIGITGRAVAMKATLTHIEASRGRERDQHLDRTRSLRVSAARKRSSIVSKASLRLPKSSKSSFKSSADVTSILSRLSKKRSLRQLSPDDKRPSVTGPPMPVPPVAVVPALKIDTKTAKAAPKDDSFLELAETRPVSPTSPMRTEMPPPPMPENIVDRLNAVRQATAAVSSSSPDPQDTSFVIDIPPITIHPADDISPRRPTTSGAGRPITRRVHSMQPSPSVRKSLDDTGRGASIKRSASDYRRFDGWPWPGMEGQSKHTRRRSMPLSRASASPSTSFVSGASTSVESVGAPPTVTTGVGVAKQTEDQEASLERPESPPMRVFSPPPRAFSPSRAVVSPRPLQPNSPTVERVPERQVTSPSLGLS